MNREMLNTEQAADYLNLSTHTLNRWRWDGRGPRFAKLGKAIRYSVADLDAFVRARKAEHTSGCTRGST